MEKSVSLGIQYEHVVVLYIVWCEISEVLQMNAEVCCHGLNYAVMHYSIDFQFLLACILVLGQRKQA
jgi:hypothetical protein